MFLLLFRFLSTQFVIHRESLYYYRPVLSLFSFGWLLQGFQGGWTVIKLYTANHHQKEVVWVVVFFFFFFLFSFLILFKEYFICHVVVHIVSPSDFLHPCDYYIFFVSFYSTSIHSGVIVYTSEYNKFFLSSGWPFDIVDLHRLAQPNNARRHPSLHISHVDRRAAAHTHSSRTIDIGPCTIVQEDTRGLCVCVCMCTSDTDNMSRIITL